MDETGRDGLDSLAWMLLVSGGVVVAVGGASFLVWWSKAMRRRRRRRAVDPSLQVLGAWNDSLDRLAEHGVRPMSSMSAAEAVAAAGGVVDETVVQRLDTLAELSNVARFDHQGASPQQAITAWMAADLVVAGLRSASSPMRRLAAAVSLAPLLRRGTDQANATWRGRQRTRRRRLGR